MGTSGNDRPASVDERRLLFAGARVGEPPPRIAFYVCPAGCGCKWRDNGDGTMSLFDRNQASCRICEPLALSELIPVAADLLIEFEVSPRLRAYLEQLVEHEGYGDSPGEVALRLVWDSIHHLIGRGVLRSGPRPSRPQPTSEGGPS